MRVEGEHLFQVSRDEVWKSILDPEVLSGILPGFEKLERVAEGEFQGAMNLRVGPVQGKFQGKLLLSDMQEPESYRLKLNGRGAPGFMDGEGSVQLAEHPTGTKMTYGVDVQVGGRIAGVGQRLLDSTAKVLTDEALQGLDRHFEASQSQEGAVVAPEAPSQAEFAGRVAKGVAADLVPPERRPFVIVVAVALVGALGFLLLRACGG